jgi:hypothetical protein
MPSISFTRELAAQAAELLELEPGDLTAASIVDALRRHEPDVSPTDGSSEREAVKRHVAQLRKGCFGPV